MIQLYSKACEYAIMALANLSRHNMRDRFTISMLCENSHIKESYARKAFQALSNGGILQAVSGPGGGYRFAKSPDEIKLLEVIQCIDGKSCFDQCILGLNFCDNENSCPMHDTWKPLKNQVIYSLQNITLGKIIKLNKKTKELSHVNVMPAM